MPTNQIIIKYRAQAGAQSAISPASTDQLQRLSEVAGVPLAYAREMSGDAYVLRLSDRVPLVGAQAIADLLNTLPEVEHAEPDAIMVHARTPNDPRYGDQWHYSAPGAGRYGINAPAAWVVTTGSASVVVAVLDSGITNHTDLSGRTVPGYDFISDPWVANDGDGRDGNPSDPGDWVAANVCYPGAPAEDSSWHGTHVAGTIGAATNNGLGVAGVDWNARILPVRVLGRCGGSISDIADGMRWAAGLPVPGVPANPNPAKVLNLSLGGEGSCNATYQSAINDILTAGATVIVAAGNSNANAANYRPGNCNGVITVAATNRNGSRAHYSNYGATVEISAPGGEVNVLSSNGVLSTSNTGTQGPVAGNYAYYQGTSMAAPHVAGVVSLLYSLNPALSPTQVLTILQNTVTSFPVGSTCNTSNCGRGILNAGAAVASISGPTATPTATATITRTPTRTLTPTRTPTLGPFTPTAFLRLPIVLKVHPIPTITPTPTATSTSAPNPIVNGDFEAGPAGWTQVSNHGWPLIVSSFPGSVAPRSGSWAVWLGGESDEVSYIQQRVTIPVGRSVLIYWHWIASEDLCGYDFGGVLINDNAVNVYDLCEATNTRGWVRHVVNLAPYAGQSVALQIRSETDSSGNSNLFVDDVALAASAAVVSANNPPSYDPMGRLAKGALQSLPRAEPPPAHIGRVLGGAGAKQ